MLPVVFQAGYGVLCFGTAIHILRTGGVLEVEDQSCLNVNTVLDMNINSDFLLLFDIFFSKSAV